MLIFHLILGVAGLFLAGEVLKAVYMDKSINIGDFLNLDVLTQIRVAAAHVYVIGTVLHFL